MAERAPGALFLAALASGIAAFFFLLYARHGFDLADEGFLWYGVQAVLRGEVPLRDFEAYDLGRYYWCALWARLLGDGLVALRASSATFQAVGLWFGLLAVRRVLRSRAELTLAGLVLGLSMPIHYKYFEPSLSLVAVFFAVLLLEDPSRRRWLAAGVATGVTACFARNLGLYDTIAFLALLTFQCLSRGASFAWSRLSMWASGVVLGYSPVLLVAALVPGFAGAFLEVLLLPFELGATNLPLPVPWPWRLDWRQPWTIRFASEVVVSVLFVSIPVYLAGLAWRLGRRDPHGSFSTVTGAASLVGVAYLHYAFSRADAAHLSFGIAPFLVGVMAWPERPRLRRAVLGLVGLAMLSSMGVVADLPGAVFPSRRPDLVSYPLGQDRLWISRSTAFLVQNCER